MQLLTGILRVAEAGRHAELLEAKGLYEPFDRLIDPDLDTREALARVIAGTVGAGQPAYVTINNKAEGSAPLSVAALAEAVRARLP